MLGTVSAPKRKPARAWKTPAAGALAKAGNASKDKGSKNSIDARNNRYASTQGRQQLQDASNGRLVPVTEETPLTEVTSATKKGRPKQ
jgi:hypothetical protein